MTPHWLIPEIGEWCVLDTEYEESVASLVCRPRLRSKVCLVGDAGVGKTSLVRRFVYNQFDDQYLKTIGTNVSKKSVMIYDETRKRETEVIMTVWDIMGQEGFRELLKEAYFDGANGILAVCDVTNPESVNKLDGWLDRTYKIAGEVPISILANKIDIARGRQVEEKQLVQCGKAYECPYSYTSAKTGENVENVFTDLASRILKKEMSKHPNVPVVS